MVVKDMEGFQCKFVMTYKGNIKTQKWAAVGLWFVNQKYENIIFFDKQYINDIDCAVYVTLPANYDSMLHPQKKMHCFLFFFYCCLGFFFVSQKKQ